MKVADVIEAIVELMGFHVIVETDTEVLFDVLSGKQAKLIKKDVELLLRKVKKMSSNENVELYTNRQYEVLVRNESLRMYGDRQIDKEDAVNKLSYSIGKPSKEYIIFLLGELKASGTPRILRRGIMPHRLKRILEDGPALPEGQIHWDILELMLEIIPRLESIQITAKSDLELKQFEKLVYAFLFNLGYNRDYIVMPLRFIDEFIQPYRIARLRRSEIKDIDAPKRTYVNELILHYQKGVSSESLDHQFLSFYHVLEHFYEKVYSDDILSRVRSELTKPSFSYKRTKDLNALINIIQKRLRYRNEEFLINEPEALELTLRLHISELTELKDAIEGFSPELLNYFKTTTVPFSNGNKFNLENENTDVVYKNLAKRIYMTRNCIVHSKENEKVKFMPFKDDKDLINENYLLRLIAEFVIMSTSREL